jgi:hypothetical protein
MASGCGFEKEQDQAYKMDPAMGVLGDLHTSSCLP